MTQSKRFLFIFVEAIYKAIVFSEVFCDGKLANTAGHPKMN